MAWVKAAIDEAHAQGIRVGVHATQRELARTMIHIGQEVLGQNVQLTDILNFSR